MSDIFNRELYKQLIEGYTIYDCAMNNSDRYTFLLVERTSGRDTLPRTRFVIVLRDRPMKERFGLYETGDLRFCTIARGVSPAEYVAVDTRSQVYSSNPQRKGEEKPIDQVVDMRLQDGSLAIIRRVVRVADHVYALGSDRKIYRRIGMDQWADLVKEGKGVPLPPKYNDADVGFKDMSAFDTNDMYAVGGHGDVWRFDGAKWHNCPFPANDTLETVTCGEDGKVYISDMKGNVWAGREDRWALVAEAEFAWGSQPTDSAWFKGRLYLGSQDGLYTLGERKTVVQVESVFDGAPRMGNCGRVDISPDGQFMLTAGSFGATLFDGEAWTKLFSSYDFM